MMEGILRIGDLLLRKLPEIENELRPKPNGKTLLYARNLELGDLEDLQIEKMIEAETEEVKEGTQEYLSARQAIAAVSSQEFTPQHSRAFTRAVCELKAKVPQLDLAHDMVLYKARMRSAILRCKKINLLNDLFNELLFARENLVGDEVDELIEGAHEAYHGMLMQIQLQANPTEFASTLYSVRKANELIDLTLYKEVLGVSILAELAKQENTSERVFDDYLDLFKMLDIDAPKLIQHIENTKNMNKKPLEAITDVTQVVFLREIYNNPQSDPRISVWEARFYNNRDRIPVAAKRYYSSDQTKLSKVQENESVILEKLSGLKYPLFLGYYGSLVYKEEEEYVLLLVMELCKYSLMDDINTRSKNNRRYTESEIFLMVHTLIEGFTMMESLGIYHQDIKPQNILLTTEGELKIVDFNVSKLNDCESSTSRDSVQGTEGYMAIELQEYYDLKRQGTAKPFPEIDERKLDVYSLGMTFLALYTFTPITGLNQSIHQDKLQQKLAEIQYPWLQEILRKMLDRNMQTRYTITQLNAFFQEKTRGLTTIIS